MKFIIIKSQIAKQKDHMKKDLFKGTIKILRKTSRLNQLSLPSLIYI